MAPPQSILVIDDEDSICLAFEQFFSRRQWKVYLAATAADGLALCRQAAPDVVFLDVRLPDRSGLDLLPDLRALNAGVVVITAYGGLQSVVRAIQGKAFDFLVKPLDLDKAYALAERILQNRRLPAAVEPAATDDPEIVGNSEAMREVYKLIARAAASDSPVLIQGETGTGKELVARAIHRYSPLGKGPFVAVNCGAIPENLVESELFGHVRGAFTGAEGDRQGRFVSADGGTLLLDEVGELPPAAQVKLLRVLEDGLVEPVGSSKSLRVHVRILASTNRNLTDEMDKGRFRRDLYYRLAVLHIYLPPLRDRRDDIEALADHFLGQSRPPAATNVDGNARRPSLAAAAALDPKVREALLHHDWPGNVRELKNALEHALAIAPDRAIVVEDLPQSVARRPGDLPPDSNWLQFYAVQFASQLPGDEHRFHHTIEQVEAALIRDALQRFQNNQVQAAQYLGIHRNTIRQKMP
jgi:DNA-binding NtrC family response regulator